MSATTRDHELIDATGQCGSKTLPLSVERCPHCGGYLLEGRFPKGTYIETICRRCHGPEGVGRPRIVIKR